MFYAQNQVKIGCELRQIEMLMHEIAQKLATSAITFQCGRDICVIQIRCTVSLATLNTIRVGIKTFASLWELAARGGL